MTDALSVLKSYLESHKTLSKENWDPSNPQTNSFISIGSHQFPRNISTRLKSRKGQGDAYTLDAICFLLFHESTPHPNYLVECSKLQCPSVSLVDKKEILDWLYGRVVNIPQLIITTPQPPTTSLSASETKQQPFEVVDNKSEEELPAKRRKIDPSATTTTTTTTTTLTLSEKEHDMLTLSSPSLQPQSTTASHIDNIKPSSLSTPKSATSFASENNDATKSTVPSEQSSSSSSSSTNLSNNISTSHGESDPGAVSAFVAETGLSLEKIQELKWKRRIIKQQTLSDVSTSAEMNDHSANQQNQNLSKSNNNIDRIQETTTTTKGDVVGAHVPLIAGPSKIDTGTIDTSKSASLIQEVLQRERPVRTRLSVLLCRPEISSTAPSPDGPFKTLLQTLQTLVKSTANKSSEQPKHYDRYKFKEDVVWKEKLKDAEDFQIDTRGTFASDTQLSMRLLTQKSDTREEGEINPSEMWPNSESAPSSKQTKKPSAPPIIIVPAALTSVLTLYNVKSFLSNGEYIDTQTRRNQGEKKPKSVFVTPYSKNMQSAQSSSVQIYEVIDNAAHLRPTDWDRVVAVFALGQQWQFKKWLWDEPVTLFNNVRGFYIHFDDEQVPENIKHWNVKILKINKHKRHLDRTAALEFWNEVENFIAKKKPHLRAS